LTTTIFNSELSATINHNGAELISLKKINSSKEYIWEGNPIFWGKHSPILFPIVGTLKNDSYTYKNNPYSLSRHGFARDMDFNLIESTENNVVLSLSSNAVTKERFPFEFELRIIYTLHFSTLNVNYQVINKGFDIMPFSIGGHPAFALPKKFETYSLQFETDEILTCYLLDNDLLSEKTKQIELVNNRLPLTYSLFENDALILKNLSQNKSKLSKMGFQY
jgi:galactose mutarotase-like enzyme